MEISPDGALVSANTLLTECSQLIKAGDDRASALEAQIVTLRKQLSEMTFKKAVAELITASGESASEPDATGGSRLAPLMSLGETEMVSQADFAADNADFIAAASAGASATFVSGPTEGEVKDSAKAGFIAAVGEAIGTAAENRE
jgi:hypothetical protein